MPVITIGANTTNTYAGVTDAGLVETSPTTNNGSATSYYVSTWQAGDTTNAVIKFTMPGVLAGATINSATLYARVSGVNGTQTGIQIAARRLLRDWVGNQVTWNVWSTGNNWTTAGGLGAGTDRVDTPSGTNSATPTLSTYLQITGLASDVQAFVNGSASNYGWHLARNDGGSMGLATNFNSSEATDGFRPYLQIDYTEGSSSVAPLSAFYRMMQGNN